MMEEYYPMLAKRKSVRKFDETLSVSKTELQKIKEQTKNLIPLDPDIRVQFQIVKKEKTTSRRGEYCLLLYSEQKENSLLNAGYLLEQMDLYLASKDIGACWYALAKPEETQLDGLDYVIMLAFGKSRPEDFRADLSKCRRKDVTKTWSGSFDAAVAEMTRFAPSSCNTQPWRVTGENKRLTVYRITGIRSFIPAKKLPFYNSIDLGIFLCFLEIVLTHNKYAFTRNVSTGQSENEKYIKVADYTIG